MGMLSPSAIESATSSERDLWSAVLGLAIDDLRDGRMGAGELHFTRLWFASNSCEPGSFLWICDHLDLKAGLIRYKAFGHSAATPEQRD
jgi:hypothetical protein